MSYSAHKPIVDAVEIQIDVVEGRDLVAKDSGGVFSKKKSSDPFVKVIYGGKTHGKTRTVDKSLSPRWNESFTVSLRADDVDHLMRGSAKHSTLLFAIFDEDSMSEDDPMGVVNVPVRISDTPPDVAPTWHKVEQGSGEYHCKKASGELLLKITVKVKQLAILTRGNVQTLAPSTVMQVVVGWQVEGNKRVDIDANCVAIDWYGNLLMNETVYYGDCSNSNDSILHSGDNEDDRFFQGKTPMETITCDMDRIPQQVRALYFVLTVATQGMSFSNIKSATVRVVNKRTGSGICQIIPSDAGQCSALFLLRVARDAQNPRTWSMFIMDATHPTARDFGALIAEVKAYSRDIVPNIVVNPNERIAILRKGGNVQLHDYFAGTGEVPDPLMFGLAWDVTKGRNIDLDASVLCLDGNLQCLDIVSFSQLTSRDQAIRHGGDEREGDEVGFDEKIYLHLQQVHPAVQFIGIVINSYSGDELDDITKASCSLLDPSTGTTIVKYGLSKSKALDKHTALVMACLHRNVQNPGSWLMRIIGEAAHGRVAKELVDELQLFLQNNPPIPPYIPPPPPPIVDCTMPAVVPYQPPPPYIGQPPIQLPTQQMQDMNIAGGGQQPYPGGGAGLPYPP